MNWLRKSTLGDFLYFGYTMRTRRGGLFGFSSRKTKYMPVYTSVNSAKNQARALIRKIIDPTSSDETVVSSMDEL